MLCVVYTVAQVLLVVSHTSDYLTAEAWRITLGCGCGRINSLFCRDAVPNDVIYVPPSGCFLRVSTYTLQLNVSTSEIKIRLCFLIQNYLMRSAKYTYPE